MASLRVTDSAEGVDPGGFRLDQADMVKGTIHCQLDFPHVPWP